MIIFIFFICCILLYLIYNIQRFENFIQSPNKYILTRVEPDSMHENEVQYKKVVVTLQRPVYDKKYIKTLYNDSLYHNYGNVLGKIYPMININGKGSLDNVQSLIKKEVNFAISQEDVVIDAINGKGAFQKKYPNICFITSLFEEKVTLIVNPIFNINSWKDLRGKTVCFGEIGSGSLYNALELCKLINITKADMKIIYGDPFSKIIFNRIKNNEIAAFYVTGEHPDPILVDMLRENMFNIIGSAGIPDDLIRLRFPTWNESYIKLSNYNIPTKSIKIKTFAVKTLLVTRQDENYTTVYNLINTLFSNILYIRQNIGSKENKEVLEYYPLSRSFPKHDLIPIHPAVISYYYYLGIFTNNNDKRCSLFAGTGNCNLDILG